MYNTQAKQVEKHNVFVSFHHQDQAYREKFDEMYGDNFISMSVDFGDIDSENSDDYIKRLIQEDHIINSSVVFALYGGETYKRKHVDWEISAGLTEKVGGHKGLSVLILPTFPVSPFNAAGQYDQSRLYPYMHPRTVANLKSGYADLYFWPGMYPQFNSVQIKDVIQRAFEKRESHDHLIDNSHTQYQRNLS
jgi:hypothetical protein